MAWTDIIRDRIMAALGRASHISESAKEEIVQQAIADTEAGRPFNAPEESPKPKADDDDDSDPVTSRGEKLSVLRKRTQAWGGWEPWSK